MKTLTLLLMLFFIGCSTSQTKTDPGFPVAGGEAELNETTKAFLIPNADAFYRLMQPYSPAALRIQNPTTHEDSQNLLNLYLDYKAASVRIDPLNFRQNFQCGFECSSKRKQNAAAQLKKLEEVESLVRKLKKVNLISQWGDEGSFRVNNFVSGKNLEYLPTAGYGLTPSEKKKQWKGTKKYLDSIKCDLKEVRRVVKLLKQSGFHAAVRDPSLGVRLVQNGGLSATQSGLLITNVPPPAGNKTIDGLEYKLIEMVKPGVFYYETN